MEKNLKNVGAGGVGKRKGGKGNCGMTTGRGGFSQTSKKGIGDIQQ